jgi:SAM-dependent methyltransferase
MGPRPGRLAVLRPAGKRRGLSGGLACASSCRMQLWTLFRARIKAARKRGAFWVRILDVARLLPTAEGQARLWTRLVRAGEVHQTTPDTRDERYPALFDLAAVLAPDAKRILSFGCSTGEELVSLRRRFPGAEIVGVEINPRSRRIAAARVSDDPRTAVRPGAENGIFDAIFALAVLQREPHKIDEMDVSDLTPFYSFEKFDAAVSNLVAMLRPGGLLCVQHAHYRVEDSSAAVELEPIPASPLVEGRLFGRDGRKLEGVSARTMLRKL